MSSGATTIVLIPKRSERCCHWGMPRKPSRDVTVGEKNLYETILRFSQPKVVQLNVTRVFHSKNHISSHIYWLVVLTILKKYESQWEGLSHILWKIIFMFQTTNQIHIYILYYYNHICLISTTPLFNHEAKRLREAKTLRIKGTQQCFKVFRGILLSLGELETSKLAVPCCANEMSLDMYHIYCNVLIYIYTLMCA